MTIKFPCEKPVANNHQAINCNKCSLWMHTKYNKINKQTYIYLMHENSHWYCMLCTKAFLSYLVLNNNEFKQTVIKKQVKFTHIAKPVISNTENFIKAINSENNITKYFTIKDLNSTFNDIGNLFSLFHLNLFILMNWKASYQSQIICITETRLKKTQGTSTNIQLKTYNTEHLTTESANGGVFSYKKRELKSDFIEIIQKDSKNIAVGCIHRHPCIQQSEFNDEYLKPLSEKLISENKEVIFLGDFNIDLLKCDPNKNDTFLTSNIPIIFFLTLLLLLD